MTSLNNKPTAIVTGGAIRLGKAFALHLAKKGWDIALHYNSSLSEAKQTQEKIQSLGQKCHLYPLDFSTSRDRDYEAYIQNILKDFPNLSLLVNSASLYQEASIQESTDDLWEKHMAINAKTPFFLSSAFAKYKNNKVFDPQIIMIIDNKINFSQYEYAVYVLSKKLLAELTKLASREFAPSIRVNGIAPGFVWPLPSRKKTEGYLEWRLENIPLKKTGEKENILIALDYLLENNFVTGEILQVDGGEGVPLSGRNFYNYARKK